MSVKFTSLLDNGTLSNAPSFRWTDVSCCLYLGVVLVKQFWLTVCVFQAFLSAAIAVRCTAPCSISTCYTTAAITHYKPPSVLAPAKSVIEDEVRRNTFWIGEYMPGVDDNRTHLTDGYP